MASESTHDIHENYEPHPDPVELTNKEPLPNGVKEGVDYEPHPEKSVEVSLEHQHIIDSITRLYSGSASEKDMMVYAEKSIYDDPWSYCDTRYKTAGQWYGIPMLFASSKTLKTEVVSDLPTEIIYKQRQEYTPKGLHVSKTADSLVSLTLDEAGKVKYHKDMWNEKDYSHSGLGKIMKQINGDQLTKVTQPPKSL